MIADTHSPKMPVNISLRWHYIAILLAVVLINVPMFLTGRMPVSDTMYVFVVFYARYCQQLFVGDWVHWAPYGTLGGVPNDLMQLDSLTPISYVVASIGALLHLQNVLAVFKVSIVCEEMVFVAGMYVCSRFLYRSRSVHLLVTVAAALFTVWWASVNFNLRIYYLFPFAVYCILRFFDTGRIELLFATGIVMLFWTLGTPPYFIGLYLMIMAVIFSVLLIAKIGVIRRLMRQSAGSVFLSGILLLGIATLLLVALHHCLDGLVMLAPGRDIHSGKVLLHTFLTYAGTLNIRMMLTSLISGNFPLLEYGGYNPNCTVFIGIVPLALALCSLGRVRHPAHIAFIAMAAVLVALSLGGSAARLIYHFPLMSYYRHIGITFGLTKVAVLFCAGFGLDNLISLEGARLKKYLAFCLIPVAALAYASWMVISNPVDDMLLYCPSRIFVILMSLGAMIVSVVPERLKRAGDIPVVGITRALLPAVVLIDLVSYQLVTYKYMPQPATDPREIRAVFAHPLEWKNRRDLAIASQKDRCGISLIEKHGPSYICVNAYNFVGYDPAIPKYRFDFLGSPVCRLVMAGILPGNLCNFIGATAPKLRLVPKAIYCRTEREALNLSSIQPIPLDTVIVQPIHAPQRPVIGLNTLPRTESGDRVIVREYSYNSLEADVNVTQQDGEWLYYSDCWRRGWRATDNGRPTPLCKADIAYKAIYLSAGKHAVVFRYYDPLSSLLSDIIACVATVAGVVMLLLVLSVGIEKVPNDVTS